MRGDEAPGGALAPQTGDEAGQIERQREQQGVTSEYMALRPQQLLGRDGTVQQNFRFLFDEQHRARI